MSKEIQAKAFLVMLANALDCDRLVRRVILGQESKSHAKFFKKLCKSDLDNGLMTLKPLERQNCSNLSVEKSKPSSQERYEHRPMHPRPCDLARNRWRS